MGPVKFADQCWVIWDEAIMLLHIIDLFFKKAIEKSIVHIKLLDRPIASKSQGENDNFSNKLNVSGGGFMKIKAMNLVNPFGN